MYDLFALRGGLLMSDGTRGDVHFDATFWSIFVATARQPKKIPIALVR